VSTNILEWLKEQGYEYTWNVKIGTKIPDLIAFKDKEVVAFEFKRRASEISKAIGQCLFYLQEANKSYIVLPTKSVQTSLFKILKKNGIGLIGINKLVKVFLEAKIFPCKNRILIKKLKSRSLGRISFVPGSKNIEGIKEKIIEILEEHPEGLTIHDLSEIIGAHRQTITKYILVLEGMGVIYRRRVGSATLHYLRKKYSGESEVVK